MAPSGMAVVILQFKRTHDSTLPRSFQRPFNRNRNLALLALRR
jgi:hypothetical protein